MANESVPFPAPASPEETETAASPLHRDQIREGVGRFNPGSAPPFALWIAEAILVLSGVTSAADFKKHLEAGRGVIADRRKKQAQTAERKEVKRQAEALVPTLICAYAASNAVEGAQSEVLQSVTDPLLADVLATVFPQMPHDGPTAGFPFRQLCSQICELFKAGQIDDRQKKTLLSAIRKANKALNGENRPEPNSSRRERQPKPKAEDEQPDRTLVRLFRGPRQISKSTLDLLPARIRTATVRIKAKPERRRMTTSAAAEEFAKDCDPYFQALENTAKALMRRLNDYAEALMTHEHDQRAMERMVEWIAQFPVAPPEPMQAILADKLDWMESNPKEAQP